MVIKEKELVQLLEVVEGITYLDFSDSSLLNILNTQDTLLVPSYVQGALIYPGEVGTRYPRTGVLRKLESKSSPFDRAELKLVTAQPTKKELQKTLKSFAEQNGSTSALTLEEKIQIFDKVSGEWPNSPEYAWCMELVPRISARNPISVKEELDLLGALVSAQSLSYLLDIKIGDHNINSLLKGWQPDTYRSFRLVPHGTIFENLAGDSALMAYMMVEDLLFDNNSIVKTGDEYISHLAFAHLINRLSPELGEKIAIYPFSSSLELDSRNPILNPLYDVLFPKNGKLLIDGVGSSGGPAAIESVRSMVPAGIPIFENHPKYSAALIIYPEIPDVVEDSLIEDTVQKMIHNGVLLHEQEACNNIRMIAISGHDSYYDKTVEYIQTSLEKLSLERKKIYQTGEGTLFKHTAYSYLNKENVQFKRSRRTPDWGLIIYNNGSHPTNIDIDNCMRRVLTVVPMTTQEFIDFWSQPELRRFTQTVQYAAHNPLIDQDLLITSLASVGFDDIYNQHTPQYVVKSHDGELPIRKAKLVNGPLVKIEDWQKTAEYINKSIEYNK